MGELGTNGQRQTALVPLCQSFLLPISRVRLPCLHRTGKLMVFLHAVTHKTQPPKRRFRRPNLLGEEAEAWKTGTRSGGCFWLEDFWPV